MNTDTTDTTDTTNENTVSIEKECTCGKVTDPFKDNLIDDAWQDKNNIAYFEFKCPDCSKKNVVRIIWTNN